MTVTSEWFALLWQWRHVKWLHNDHWLWGHCDFDSKLSPRCLVTTDVTVWRHSDSPCSWCFLVTLFSSSSRRCDVTVTAVVTIWRHCNGRYCDSNVIILQNITRFIFYASKWFCFRWSVCVEADVTVGDAVFSGICAALFPVHHAGA